MQRKFGASSGGSRRISIGSKRLLHDNFNPGESSYLVLLLGFLGKYKNITRSDFRNIPKPFIKKLLDLELLKKVHSIGSLDYFEVHPDFKGLTFDDLD